MRQRILCLLSDRRNHVKREWGERLRKEPVRSALTDPSILVYMMDDTLDQLVALLMRKTRPRKLRGADFESRCICRLNPLLAYFATGERSLTALLEDDAPVEEPLRMLVKSTWGLVAQREIDAICGLCVRNCQQPYPKIAGQLTPPESVDAGGRGTR